MLTENQIAQVKQQLVEQINTAFPQDKRQSAIAKITSMNAAELEEFIKQNQLMKNSQTPQCVFCSIVSEQTPSYKIDDNKKALAALEINPISKAHTIIIPKEHVSSSKDVPRSAFSLAKKVAKKIQSKFKPKEVKIYFQNIFGHEIINLLPIYEDENMNSEREEANPKDLQKLQNSLEKKQRKKSIRKPRAKKISKGNSTKQKLKLPQRIP
ncbi:HIT family protein [Nanoarchaeota archaeon]